MRMLIHSRFLIHRALQHTGKNAVSRHFLHRAWPVVTVAMIASAPGPAAAQVEVVPCRPAPCASGRPCRPCPPWVRGVERVRSAVLAELGERVVRYEISETFVNHGPGLGEADYLLPLPRNAAFRELRLFINGEPVAGEVMGADQARAIYEEIVRTQRDPALVEWMGHGLLRARIFPIAPGERKEVLVRFDAITEREGDALRVDYFRGRRGQARPVPTPRLLGNGGVVADDDGRESWEGESFRLRYPASMGRAYSPTHRVTIRDDGRFRIADLRGDGAQVTALVPVPRANGAAVSAISHASRGERHVLLTIAPPARTGPAIPRDITLVLDVSGSMRGEKMEQARAAGEQLLRGLGEQDRFRLIAFSSDVRTFREDYSAATRANVNAGVDYLRRLNAMGGTNVEEALLEALRGGTSDARLPLILFLTDGMPTVGETRADVLAELVAERRRGRRVFTFGVGADVNVALLEQLAMDGRGTAHFVRSTESIEHAVSVVASRLSEPLLTDVRIEAEGVRIRDAYPRLPVDIFAGQDLVLLARYEGSGRSTVRVTGRAAGRAVSFQTGVTFPANERRNDFVPRLWATRRIGHLIAERRRSSDARELNEEIRRLALRYGLPSDVSSYLVLEPGMERPMVAQGATRRGRETDLSGRGVAGAGAPPAVPSSQLQLSEVVVTGVTTATAAFESGRAAAAQRDATSLAATDETAAGRRTVGNRVFALHDSTWVQVSPVSQSSNRSTLRIKPFSGAYFQIMDAIPELRPIFALGERLLVHGHSVTIELHDFGTERLTGARLAALADAWQSPVTGNR